MFKDLTHDQARHMVDVRQVFEEREACLSRISHSFSGSMRWVSRKGYDYLLKKDGTSERSLGRRDENTVAAYSAFIEGREETRARVQALTARLEAMAPMSKALRLNRLPLTAARVLRHLRDAGLLGEVLVVVGTTSLFLYESIGAVQLEGGLLATGDMDLLWDARRALTLAGVPGRDVGILAILRRADRSFHRAERAPFRAVNRDGFMIDFIRPIDMRSPAQLSEGAFEGAEIVGLQWLVNAPKIDDVVIAHDGYPVRVWGIDPRVFALHKLWLAERPDREPAKRKRDRDQARVAAAMAARVGLDMRDQALSSLPAVLREGVAALLDDTGGEG